MVKMQSHICQWICARSIGYSTHTQELKKECGCILSVDCTYSKGIDRLTMDDPSDFDNIDGAYRVGDLVQFTGYHFSPDYKYIDEDDYKLGLVLEVKKRTYYKPVYTVFWFKSGYTRDVVEDHLSLVVKQIKDYL